MTSLHSLLRNVVYSGRSLLRQPGQGLVIVLTLAVGIGANTAIFGFVMEYFYWESGAPEPDRLFYVVTGTEESKNRSSSYPDALSYQESLGEIGELSIWVGYGAVVRLPGDQNGEGMSAYRVGRGVSGKTFELLGVRAAQGRLFSEEDMRPGAPPVAVLQNYFWRRYLGADPEIIGQTLEVNGMAFTVVGVVQREKFDFDLESGSLFVPIHHLDDISGFDQLSDPAFRQFKTMFRLRDEVAVLEPPTEKDASGGALPRPTGLYTLSGIRSE